MLILILINVQYSQKAFCVLHVFFNIQTDYVVYIKKHIETDTTWVKWELKTPLLNNELNELDRCPNSNILPWILCHYFVHGSYIWSPFYWGKLPSKMFPQMTGKCQWEVQKSLVDSPWNVKWEIYNKIKWFYWIMKDSL